MRKKLASIFLGILVVLTILYVIRYKRALVFENKVPNSTTQVLHINARQIEHHLLMDAIQHPLKYIDFKISDKKKDSLRLKKTIEIPRNVFFFTNETTFENSWFSSFVKVKKKTKLSQYLEQESFVKTIHDDIMVFSKKDFAIAIKDERLVIAYTKEPQTSVINGFKVIFDTVSFLAEESQLLQQIRNSKSDISYTTIANDFVEANFKDGLLEVLGALNTDMFLNARHDDFNDNSVGYLNAKINKEHTLFKSLIAEKNSQKFNDLTKLSVDSITSKWNGTLSLNLKTVSKKIDTIVTYEYDDDFNKIEKKTVQELTIPDIDLRFGEGASLFDYLSNENAIQVIESDTLFTSIPLYKMYAARKAKTVAISTENDFSKPSVTQKRYKLNAYFDIETYVQNPLEFSSLPNNTYTQLLKDTSIQLSEKNKLSVTITLKDSDRNFIGQFIKP